MSKSILYARDIETDQINGTSGQVIDPDVNAVGQVLRITSLDPKAVAFEDLPSGVPDAVGFPDGYVLKIVDNTTNTVSWEPDIGGGAAVPFILTGDSVNALKVQGTDLQPMIRIDTVDKEVHMDSNVVIKGTDDSEKFVVKDNLGNNIFQVATNGDSVFIGGNQNSGAKLSIFDPFFNLIFLVDTNNNSLVMGNGAITPSEIYLRPNEGIVEIVGKTNGILKSAYKCSHIVNPTGGSVEMSAFRDNTDYNKIESTGAQGLLISSDTVVNVSGSTEFLTTAPTTSFAPIGGTGLCNKSYVDDRVGGLSSGITNSPTAVGTVIGTNQPLNPTSFLPSSPSTPANYFKAGQSFSLVMSGPCQFFNGDTFDIKLIATNSLANVVNLGIINITTPNTAASVFELEADFTIRSIVGPTANVVCSFDFTYNDAGSIVGKRSFTSASIRADLVETLTTAINYSSANASSTITTGLFILKKLVDV